MKRGNSRQRVRLSDIAAQTGFSVNTVSLALRNSERLSEKTRETIRKVAKDLDYLPNMVAASLSRSQTFNIGLILTDIMNPVLTEVAKEVANALQDNGYSALFATSNNDLEREQEIINTFRSRQADGLLVFPVNHSKISSLERLRADGYPVISFVGPDACELDVVGMDELNGAILATEHLISQGHQQIAMIDAASPLGNTSKFQGFRAALTNQNHKFNPEYHHPVHGHSSRDGYVAMAELWEQGSRPTAVFATCDTVAIGVLRWCHEMGMDVPNEMAIVGFDNIELASNAHIPLTTIDYPVEEIAKAAVTRLLSMINQTDEFIPPSQILFRPRLMKRETS